MKIVGKMICVFRDAAAVFLAAAAKRSAALRRTVGAANVLNCSDLPLHGIVGERLGRPRIERSLGTGRDFPRYSAYHSGSWFSFECEPAIVNFRAIVSHGIVPRCMSEASALGFDIYTEGSSGRKWIGSFNPKSRYFCSVRSSFEIEGDGALSEVVVYLPILAKVNYFEVSIQKDRQLFPANHSWRGKPLVFYGSSITQGCSASKAGTTYPALVGRALGLEVFNYGFSSSARGEVAIADYVACIDSSAVIVEYDHNVTVEELRNTHYRFYEQLRTVNPNTVILFVSRMSGGISITEAEEAERFEIISDTYSKAISAGDTKVALLRGNDILPKSNRADYFADDRHPNQAGMLLLSKKIESVLREKLEIDDAD